MSTTFKYIGPVVGLALALAAPSSAQSADPQQPRSPGAPPSAQQPSPSTVMEWGRIGPVKSDWKQADLLVSGFKVEREITNIWGDEVYRYVVQARQAGPVEMWFRPDGRSFRLATQSPSFTTTNGAHVGETLAELRKRYPKGREVLDYLDGRIFTFVVEERKEGVMTFDFDGYALADGCFQYKKPCPAHEDHRSLSFRFEY